MASVLSKLRLTVKAVALAWFPWKLWLRLQKPPRLLLVSGPLGPDPACVVELVAGTEHGTFELGALPSLRRQQLRPMWALAFKLNVSEGVTF